MNLGNVILTGLKETWAHKFRSLLTMLGIILGVSSLVAMSALVKGMEIGLKEALGAMGGLEKIRVEAGELPLHQRHLQDRARGVTLKDVYALKNSAPLVDKITPTVSNSGRGSRTVVSHNGNYARPYDFSGTWPDALEINEHQIAYGRMFNHLDNDLARPVCVIGQDIRDDLFGEPVTPGAEVIPVGETININGQPFTIIGMFKHYESKEMKKKREDYLAQKALNPKTPEPRLRDHYVFRIKNRTVYVPLNTMLLTFRTGSTVNSAADAQLSTLYMKIPDVELLEPALQQVRNVMMMSHGGLEDFAFRTDEDWASEITLSIKNARMSGGIIAAICLIVGGIGIANIMLASISERVREIGIRKSVGATTGDVFIQILVESVVITLLGGLAGLVCSYGLVQIIGNYSPSENDPVVTFGSLMFALGASVTVGLIAGLFPAVKASKLHPIQALKYD